MIDMQPNASRFVTFQTSDPDHLVDNLVSVVPTAVSIEPCNREPFHAAVQLIRLPRLGLFTIQMSNAEVLHPEPLGYCSITVPLEGPFQTVSHGQTQTFATDTAYINHWDDPFDIRTGDGTKMIVANLDLPFVEAYARKLNGGQEPEPLQFGSSLSLVSPSGASFWRYLSFIWSELGPGGAIGESELILRELEDALVAMLFYAWQKQDVDATERDEGHYPAALQIAEGYILAHLADPVSVADLSEVSGISARTLFKAFHRRHDSGPMGFLKARRLEAAQRALLAADPSGTTVTEIAMRFGFFHLGQFSKDYRQAFQELPSETLRR